MPDAAPSGYHQRTWSKGFGNQIGPIFERAPGDGSYALAFSVGEQHTNGMGICHGGMLMAFADMAFGRVISVQRQRYWVTVRLLTDFVSSAQKGDWVEGNAEIVGDEDDMISVRGRIWVGDRTVLSGTALFKVLGARPPGT